MSVFSTDAKDAMLDALTCDEIQLHDGDPGAAGTANRVGDTDGVETAVFAAASSASRALNANVDFTNLSADQSVTWISVWESGVQFQGKAQITSGDVAANAAGEYTVTTATSLDLDDPA
jgi:hypothetical protein